jgi:hypothetical protein
MIRIAQFVSIPHLKSTKFLTKSAVAGHRSRYLPTDGTPRPIRQHGFPGNTTFGCGSKMKTLPRTVSQAAESCMLTCIADRKLE